MHVSLAAEPVFHIGSFSVTNSLIASVLVSLLLIIAGYVVSLKIKRSPGKLQNVFEIVIETLLEMGESSGGKKARAFMPLVITIFLYIILANWIGLLPGFGSIGFYKAEEGHRVFTPILRGATADLNTTLALALVAVGSVQFYGVKHLKMKYFKKFFDISSPIAFFTGFLETISEISKIISFSFRLFGNIFAGEVLLAVVASLIPVVASLPFLGLEIFVGFVQALVFSLLTMVFINMAISHGEEVENNGS